MSVGGGGVSGGWRCVSGVEVSGGVEVSVGGGGVRGGWRCQWGVEVSVGGGGVSVGWRCQWGGGVSGVEVCQWGGGVSGGWRCVSGVEVSVGGGGVSVGWRCVSGGVEVCQWGWRCVSGVSNFRAILCVMTSLDLQLLCVSCWVCICCLVSVARHQFLGVISSWVSGFGCQVPFTGVPYYAG